MSKSFAFILNPLEIIGGSNSIEIMPKCFLQKASENQVNVLKKTLLKLPASPFWLNSYEYDFGKIHEEPARSPTQLPPEEWKYWLIANDGYLGDDKTRKLFFFLECSLSLLKTNLEFGPTFFNQTGSNYQWNPRSMYNYFLDYQYGGRPTTKINPEEVKEIGTNYYLIDDFMKKMYTIILSSEKTENDYYQESFQHIDRALRRSLELKSLPRYSGLTIIGLFSIIESLITHNPEQNIDDSLNHQIKTKIPLLRRRFQRDLDYGQRFGSAKEETIWSKLYAYRSKIVHVGNEDIENDKDLKILNDMENVTDFLGETTKLLILLALKEPQLITDLKAC